LSDGSVQSLLGKALLNGRQKVFISLIGQVYTMLNNVPKGSLIRRP
jgi:hypothetical protein